MSTLSIAAERKGGSVFHGLKSRPTAIIVCNCDLPSPNFRWQYDDKTQASKLKKAVKMATKHDPIGLALLSFFKHEFGGGLTVAEMVSDSSAAAKFCQSFREQFRVDLEDHIILTALQGYESDMANVMGNSEEAIQARFKILCEVAFERALGAPCAVKFYKDGSTVFVVSPNDAKHWDRLADPVKIGDYQKFTEARRAMMLPHLEGEQEAIGRAFSLCRDGLRDLQRESLLGNVASWVADLERLLSAGPDACGQDRQCELSRLVCNLADHFHREFWSGSSH